jgi:hypothetical protein
MTIKSWASLADEDDEINEELAPMTPQATKIPDQRASSSRQRCAMVGKR